jgi:stress-induced morphogen
MFAAKEIERIISEALPGAHVTARDTTGTSDHFELTVVAPQFAGKSLVDRHRMIYGPLAEPLKGPIHALVLKTLAPDEK